MIHCGSGPVPGGYTGPQPIRRLLRRYPQLRLIIAHMGMPEYAAFLDVCERSAQIRLDTTMAFTPFVDETMPFPPSHQHRLRQLGDRILFGSDFPNIPYGYADAMRLWARSRREVNRFYHDFLVPRGIYVTNEPREYPHCSPGYYAVFFDDPINGIHWELARLPTIPSPRRLWTSHRALSKIASASTRSDAVRSPARAAGHATPALRQPT